MPGWRLGGCLLYPALLVAAGPGCQVFHSYRPVAVLVQDAESRQPVPGAEVRLHYSLHEGAFNPPHESAGTTARDGVARLEAAPYEAGGVVAAASAPGYLPAEVSVSTAAIREVGPAPLFGADERQPVPVVVEVFAGPWPSVELILPTGYRGLLRVKLRIDPSAPCPPGQRCFSYPVPESGEVEVKGPPLLGRFSPPEYRARYADGTPLSRQAAPLEVGLRWLKVQAGEECFVVGTQSDHDLFRRTSQREAAQSRPAGGRGGGRGGRHGRGGQGSGESSDG
jgi:hypothetical protein